METYYHILPSTSYLELHWGFCGECNPGWESTNRYFERSTWRTLVIVATNQLPILAAPLLERNRSMGSRFQSISVGNPLVGETHFQTWPYSIPTTSWVCCFPTSPIPINLTLVYYSHHKRNCKHLHMFAHCCPSKIHISDIWSATPLHFKWHPEEVQPSSTITFHQGSDLWRFPRYQPVRRGRELGCHASLGDLPLNDGVIGRVDF